MDDEFETPESWVALKAAMPSDFTDEATITFAENFLAPHTDDDTPIKRTIFWKGFEIGLQYQPFDLRHEKLLPCGYGEIVGTNGQDGMALDCYVGSDLESDLVFVVDQLNAATGEFDEHKLFIGFDDDAATIKDLFVSLMGQERFGGIRETVPAKVWDLHEDSEHFDKRCGKGFIAENLECHKDPVSEDLTSEFGRNLETFTNTKGERRWLPTQAAATTYSTFNINNPPVGLTGAGALASTQLSVVRVATLDLNQSLALPPKGGSPAEDPFDEQLEWNKAILKKALPFGGIVTLADDMFEGAPKRTKKMAAALGLKLPEFMFNLEEEKPDTVKNIVKWARSEVPDRAEDFVKRINGFYIGKYSNGKITPVTKHDVESIDAIRKLRQDLIRPLVVVSPNPETEEKTAAELAKIEDAYLGRKPTKIKSLEAYKARANKWAEERFGKVDAGANGFSLEQTLAHDVAHPIVHEMLKSSTDGINKRFGSTLQNDGRPSLVLEEAIVNVAEHLSRGDSIEASILNGLRLAKVLSRNKEVQSDAVRAQVRDRAFTHELAKMGHELYRHKNFSLYMKYIRETNRISGTVTQAGDDFTNSASGG
jgi:Inorganic Pyrophosphatase